MSPPHSGLQRILKAFKAFWHFSFKYMICSKNASFLSKMSPKNVASFTAGIFSLYMVSSGF